MIQLIWGVLNLVILIYFIIICFKSTRIIHEKLGFFSTLFLVLGLLSIIEYPNDAIAKTKVFDLQNQSKEVKQNQIKGNAHFIDITLEEDITTKIQLWMTVKENEKEIKPLTAFTERSGFVMGTNWKTETIDVYTPENQNKCFYDVSGTLEWRLLGIKIYSELKCFKGEVQLKK